MTVAVLDTGVAQVSDIRGALLAGADFSAGTTSSGNGQTDEDGHGTSIAVLIAGAGGSLSGFAPEAKILPVRDTNGDEATTDQMAAAIEYGVSHHASVINISQGLTASDATLTKAVQDAEAANIVVVAASGNESQSTVDFPAAIPGVLAVGATENTGSIWPKSNTGTQIALTAPGVKVPAEDETGAVTTSDGTSDSTAYVSATVALIRSAHPSWTAGQVIRDLIATADPGPGPGQSAGAHSDQYGYGIVDPLKALQASAPADTSNPLLGTASNPPTTAASAGTNPSTATTSGTGVNTGHSSSSGSAVIGGIVVLVVVGIIVLLIVWLVRRNRNRPGGPGGPGGQPPYGGPGAQQPGYGIPPQYPQQQPQQNPYQPQQPPYPQAQPPYAPPQQYLPPQQPPYPPQQQQNPEQQNPYGYR